MINQDTLKQLADSQYGYFTAQQAIAAGLTKGRHVYHVRLGNWLKIDRAIFRLTGYPDHMASRFVRWSLWASKRHGGRRVVISHNSALAHYGLTGDNSSDVHLSVPLVRQPRSEKPGCVFHQQNLSEPEIVWQQGFFVTTAFRTLQDMRPDLVIARSWEPTVLLAQKKQLITPEQRSSLLQNGENSLSEDRACVMTAPSGTPATMAQYGFSPVQQERTRMFQLHQQFRSSRQGASALCVPNRSFTLVEMLVVIAIICILAGLLMPSLQRAVESGRSAKCGNQHKQMVMGALLYADENNDFLPVSSSSRGPVWIEEIIPYVAPNFLPLKTTGLTWLPYFVPGSLFRCPTVPQSTLNASTQAGGYGWNSMEFGISDTDASHPRQKRQSVKQPSQTILLGDSSDDNSVAWYPVGFFGPGYYCGPGDRHYGGINVAWVDGHVTWNSQIFLLTNPSLYKRVK